jgi:transposase InsO family protein
MELHKNASTCKKLDLRHLRTRPDRPPDQMGKPNASSKRSCSLRLGNFLSFYNHRRPHASLSRHTPAHFLREQRPEK